MLSGTQLSFTAINDSLNISSSHLTYHLDSLRELVSKNDASYRLSVFGRAAVDMMNGIEDPPREIGPIHVKDTFKLISGVLLVTLMARARAEKRTDHKKHNQQNYAVPRHPHRHR